MANSISDGDILLIYTNSSGTYCCSQQHILNVEQKPIINGFSTSGNFKLKLIETNIIQILEITGNNQIDFIYKNN